MISDRSSDYRAITMPMRNPVTGDHAVRLALNYAVNRQAMVDGRTNGSVSVPDGRDFLFASIITTSLSRFF